MDFLDRDLEPLDLGRSASYPNLIPNLRRQERTFNSSVIAAPETFVRLLLYASISNREIYPA